MDEVLYTQHNKRQVSCKVKINGTKCTCSIAINLGIIVNDFLISGHVLDNNASNCEIFYHKLVLFCQELKSQLDTCLSDGTPLLVTDCNMDIIMTDKRFLAVLASRSRFISSNMPFKLMVCHTLVKPILLFKLYEDI